ncbi:hypothetical protein GNI_065400 [Gregarina niphandrodes]|uniref:Uncharacterized protein n=1 Tax=Gregarina niphandrodes TaxID=110365 RepID=A0A023B7Z5_GRENI|nr:hypothetical protein GNI_065400 [Gregarina niphandrodes]EZG67933.1 hypothetical protein GNI_065400 [Gregarina niphandrodes]|eukprot:XP_011130132.1 hypothetical protein GNI_065400 [Gregarina niphandrodes]
MTTKMPMMDCTSEQTVDACLMKANEMFGNLGPSTRQALRYISAHCPKADLKADSGRSRRERERSCTTSLVVVQPRVPTLLGVDVLVKTGLLEVDEAGMRLTIPALYTEVEPPKQARKDVVSGVDETKSDEELLRGARQEVQTQAQHLSDDDFEQLWSVLQT